MINDISFYEYSQRFINKDSPTGDLARDIRDDELFPEVKNTHEEIKSYLIGRNACNGALRAFNTMWYSYLAFLRRLR